MNTALSAARRADILAQLGVTTYVRRLPAAPVDDAAPAPAATRAGVFLAYDTAEAGAEPLRGAYGRLLGDIVAALGNARTVHWHAGAPAAGVAEAFVSFGLAPQGAARAVLAPPLAALRISATAKRALWRDLRALARRGD